MLIEDNGPIHLSKLSLAALATRSHWLTLEGLSKYASELNDIEIVWRDLKAHHLAYQTLTDVIALDQAIHEAVHPHAPHRGRVERPARLVCKRYRDFDRDEFDRVTRVRLAGQVIRVWRGLDHCGGESAILHTLARGNDNLGGSNSFRVSGDFSAPRQA